MTSKSADAQFATMAEQINNINENVRDIKRQLENNYVTKVSFDSLAKEFYSSEQHDNEINADKEERIRSIEKRMWGAIGASGVLASVVTYIINLVIR